MHKMTLIRSAISIIFVVLILVACNAFNGNQKTTMDALNQYSQTGLHRNNSHAVELMLVYREMERARESYDQLKRNGYSIHGFYHTSTWQPHWKSVLNEQLQLLDGKRSLPVDFNDPNTAYHMDLNQTWTSLLNYSTSLFINVGGRSMAEYYQIHDYIRSLKLVHDTKITVGYNETLGRGEYGGLPAEKKAEYDLRQNVSEGEHSTVEMLHNFCKEKTARGEKAIVYYIHSKGGCCVRKKEEPNRKIPVAAWREMMDAFTVEFPSICMRAMLKGYSACGAENQDAHYSGNFWWADCQHVAALPALTNRYDAFAAEFFALRGHPEFHIAKKFGFYCGYSVNNCGVNLYDNECTRASYREKLFKYIHYRLGPNSVGIPRINGGDAQPQHQHGHAHGVVSHNHTKICRELRSKGDYYSQQDAMRKIFE